jgi:glycosyltransferase involved in cell wall biosynthesis
MATELPGVIIPAYQPGEPLCELVDELLDDEYPFVIVVDDGSDSDRRRIFESLAERPRVRVLTHAVNLGKGDALKTAFNEVLVRFPESPGVITVDADGQHLAADVRHVADALIETPDQLCLGVRAFSGRVPLRSRLGNSLTRQIFRLLIGGNVRDTQTGLRGIPARFLRDLLTSKAARYEFELQMLIRARELGIACRQIPIETVYDAGNATSHFDPLLDSLRVYFVFIRFLVSSMLTGAIDILAFSIAFGLGAPIFASAAVGRLVAGTFNFIVNKRVVFKSEESLTFSLAKYVLLVATMTTISYLLIVEISDRFQVNVYLAKVSVEGVFFLVSFAVQRLLVFGGKSESWAP